MNASQVLGFLVVIAALGIASCVMVLCRDAFRISELRPGGVFVWSFALLILAGTPFVFARFTHRNTEFLFGTCIAFVMTVIGIGATDRAFASSSPPTARGELAPTSLARTIPIVLIAVGLTAVYFIVVGQIPLLLLLSDRAGSGQLDLSREAAFKLLPPSIAFVFGLVRGLLLPFLAALTLLEARRTRSLLWWMLFSGVATVSLVFAAATLEKSVVGGLLIAVYLSTVIASGHHLTLRRMAVVGFIGLVFPLFVVLGTLGFNMNRFGDSLRAIGRRVFYLPSEVLYRYFDYFPTQRPHLMGRTWPYVSKFLPGGNFPIENKIYLFGYGDRAGAVASGSANAAYPGALWADFGWFGIVAGGLILGVLIRSLQQLGDRLPHSASTVAYRAILAYQVVALSATSFAGLLDPLGPGFAVVLAVGGVALLRPTRSHQVSTLAWPAVDHRSVVQT